MPHPTVPENGSSNGGSRFDEPLRVEGFKGTSEEIERQWFEEVYRGRGDSMPQLTLRAVLMGTALGGVLSLTNLYIGLQAGGSFGDTATARSVSRFASKDSKARRRRARGGGPRRFTAAAVNLLEP